MESIERNMAVFIGWAIWNQLEVQHKGGALFCSNSVRRSIGGCGLRWPFRRGSFEGTTFLKIPMSGE